MKTVLILARHGATTWNEQTRIQGQSDEPLSSRGVMQAHALAAWLKDQHVHQIYSSDLCRSKQTAEIIAGHLQLAINLSPDLRERDLGCFEGMDYNQLVSTRHAMGIGSDDPYQDWHGVDGVESDNQIWDRVNKLIVAEGILNIDRDGCVVLVSHAGVIKSFLHRSFLIPETRKRCFKLEAAGAVAFGYRNLILQMTCLWQNPIRTKGD